MKDYIVVEDVRYSVKEGKINKHILDGLSHNFTKSNITTISGPSGSGKTSFLYALAGLLNNIDGKISINGHDIYKMNSSERDDFRLQNLSVVFQNLNLFSFMNVEDNILMPFHVKKKNITEKTQNKVSEYLDLLGLKQIHKRSINSLSGGEQQRVAIIRALIDNPSVVLCDEPTASLDQNNTDIFMENLLLTRQIFDSTVIISTHDERVIKYGDDKIQMVNGVVI